MTAWRCKISLRVLKNLILCIWEESASLWKQSDKRKLALCNVFFQNASITIQWKFFFSSNFPSFQKNALSFCSDYDSTIVGFPESVMSYSKIRNTWYFHV